MTAPALSGQPVDPFDGLPTRAEMIEWIDTADPSTAAILIDAYAARVRAADRAAGVVRVDTTSEAVVERVAKVISTVVQLVLEELKPGERGDARDVARAVLAALREDQ